MIFSLTGLAYLILFLSLGFLTFRFFQYWREKRDTTSKLFLLLIIPLALFALVRVISVLFFAKSTQALASSVIFVSFFQSLSAAVVAYLIIHLKFPKISPWVGFITIFFFGVIVTILTGSVQYHPTFGDKGVVDWGFPSSGASVIYPILRLVIILATFFPLIIILFQQFKHSEDAFLRRRSLGLSLVLFLGIVLGFIDFVLNNILELKAAIYRDYTTIVMGFLIFLIVLFTQKPPTSEKIKKELTSQPSSKIPW